MGAFRSIKRSQALVLAKAYPQLRSSELGTDAFPNVVRICIFDRYLDAGEAIELIDNVSPSERERRNHIWRNFNEMLVNQTRCFSFKWRSRTRPIFREPKSTGALLTAMDPSQQPRLWLLLPEYRALYEQSWDDTNLLYCGEKGDLDSVIHLAKKAGLYVLK